jgi:hypothetical protein
MPNRHLLRKKSRSRHSSTSTHSTRTKPNNRRAAPRHRTRPPAARQARSDRESLHFEQGQRAIADMLGDPSLSFTAAARKWKVDRRWLRQNFGSDLQKDSSGRVKAKVRNPRYKTLYKPTAIPGMPVPVLTKSKRERLELGEWMAALNEAGRDDWSRIRKFPKGKRIGGVLLETDPKEVQAILEAIADEESPFEALYRAVARPS